MMKLRYCFFALIVIVLAGCKPTFSSTPTQTPIPSPTLGAVMVNTTSVPDARLAAQAYLDAWKAEDYEKMYSLLTSISRDAISREDFVDKFDV